MNGGKEDESFASELSYILICGVALSFAAEVIGLALYYLQTGGFAVDFSGQWQLTSSNFFSYVGGLLSAPAGFSATRVMAVGIVILMLTPYVRVLASAVHFGTVKNAKYLLFTLFVLTVLTLSLSI